MQTRTRIIKRLALGLVLVLAAAGCTMVIKDLLAVRAPENSLPSINIMYRDAPLPAVNYTRDSYSWRFITGTQVGSITPQAFSAVQFAPVTYDTPMEIFFSYQPKDIVMSVAYGKPGPYTEEDFMLFEEYEEDVGPLGPGRYVLYDNRYFYTPTEAGEYVIRIWADWGWRGSVLYYIKLDVVR